MRRVLVVANRTAECPELLDALRTRTMQGPCQFTLLVPSTPHGITWAADMHGGGEEAEQHRVAFLKELRDEGLNVNDAKVGDPDPLAAIQGLISQAELDGNELVGSGTAGGQTRIALSSRGHLGPKHFFFLVQSGVYRGRCRFLSPCA